jgi:hypothetical protein
MAGEVIIEAEQAEPVAVSETKPTTIERRIRASGVLLIMGLVVEAISLKWAHPTAFLVFMFIGGTAMAAGVLLFFYSLVSNDGSSQ